MVVRGSYFDNVAANEVATAERAQHREKFSTRQPTGLGRTRTRRVRRVEHVDIDGHVRRSIPYPRGDFLNRALHPDVVELNGRKDLKSEIGVLIQILGRVQGTTNADVH